MSGKRRGRDKELSLHRPAAGKGVGGPSARARGLLALAEDEVQNQRGDAAGGDAGFEPGLDHAGQGLAPLRWARRAKTHDEGERTED